METTASYKPISIDQHGLLDYAFGIAAATVPTLIGADKKVIRLYQGVAVQVLLYGALSKHRYALKPLIPSNIHLAIDIANLTGIALLSGYRKIRKDKNSLSFNLALLGIGLANVVLTNWTGKSSS
ncbi:MAG: hypothetical protein WKF66_06545 [Pedobacter sp.]